MRRAVVTLWGPFIAALVVIFWLSSLSRVPGTQHVWDKALHVAGYAVLGVLALRAFHGGLRDLRARPTFQAAAAVILWGISDEIHQSFVPGRQASSWDVVADVIGFSLAVMLFASLTRLRRSEGAVRPR